MNHNAIGLSIETKRQFPAPRNKKPILPRTYRLHPFAQHRCQGRFYCRDMGLPELDGLCLADIAS